MPTFLLSLDSPARAVLPHMVGKIVTPRLEEIRSYLCADDDSIGNSCYYRNFSSVECHSSGVLPSGLVRSRRNRLGSARFHNIADTTTRVVLGSDVCGTLGAFCLLARAAAIVCTVETVHVHRFTIMMIALIG